MTVCALRPLASTAPRSPNLLNFTLDDTITPAALRRKRDCGLLSFIVRAGGLRLRKDLPSPLAVMMLTMHKKWASGDEEEAVALAKAVAPYVHPKAATRTPAGDFSAMRDDQLDEVCGGGAGGTGAAEGNPE